MIEKTKIDLDVPDYQNFLHYLEREMKGTPLEKLVDFYLMALKKEIPKTWEKILIEFKSQKDPEYKKYLELKKKFE